MEVKPVPEGYHTVTPYLTVDDADKLLDFVKRAFGAKVAHEMRGDDGSIRHADVVIGDSHVMMGQAGGPWKPMPAGIYVYLPDCDAAYRRALAAGGTSIMEPADQFYGDRHGGVTDPCGNQWWVATHIEEVSPEEINRRAEAEARKQQAAV
jgi:PhnB protein